MYSFGLFIYNHIISNIYLLTTVSIQKAKTSSQSARRTRFQWRTYFRLNGKKTKYQIHMAAQKHLSHLTLRVKKTLPILKTRK